MDIEDVKKNVKIMIEGKPFNIDDVEFVKPGKGRAIYRLKLRNLRDGSTLERTYHSSEKVEQVNIGTQEEQFLYKESDNYIFMNTESFEQQAISGHLIGEKAAFLKEGTVVTVTMMGDEPIEVVLPTFVELQVIGSDITTKTATITPQNKAAKIETGFTIGVPAFIKEGDVIKIDTRTGVYVERITGKK